MTYCGICGICFIAMLSPTKKETSAVFLALADNQNSTFLRRQRLVKLAQRTDGVRGAGLIRTGVKVMGHDFMVPQFPRSWEMIPSRWESDVRSSSGSFMGTRHGSSRSSQIWICRPGAQGILRSWAASRWRDDVQKMAREEGLEQQHGQDL